MKKKVKIIVWCVIGLAVVGGIAWSMIQPLAVGITVLESTTARVTFTQQGVYRFDTVMEVRPLLSGELLELRAREGDTVRRGDVLAVISARDVEFELERLESSVQALNAQIANLSLGERQVGYPLAGTRNQLLGQLASIDAQITGHASAGWRKSARRRKLSAPTGPAPG
jgi:multidrug efflux pump subunit AcrA (membrane-fusion protein)